MIRRALAGATAITAGSAYARALCIERGVPPEKVTVAPLGIDSQRFQPAPVPSLTQPHLIQVANLVPVKDQAFLLQVFAGVHAALPEARLLLAGDGPQQPALMQQAGQLGIAESVAWLGPVPHSQLAAVYHQTHLYIQSSRYESQGMSVLEAMACGRPVLGTPVGVLPEVAAAPPAWRASDLVEQAVALLQDGERLAAASQAAQEAAHRHFNLATAGMRFIEHYHRLLHDVSA
jgi:glycosyltransferase involved in cell wall biosynthesis